MLTLPPETQNGRTFRLAGLGLPHLSGGGKGNLYAKVKVVLPANLVPRERELLEEIRALQKAEASSFLGPPRLAQT